MVQIWMFSDEWLVRYTPLEKLERKTALNSTNATRGSTNEWTYEWTNIRMDKWKDENYIPLGINARGINSSSHIMRKPVLWFMGTTKAQIRLSRDTAQFFFLLLLNGIKFIKINLPYLLSLGQSSWPFLSNLWGHPDFPPPRHKTGRPWRSSQPCPASRQNITFKIWHIHRNILTGTKLCLISVRKW